MQHRLLIYPNLIKVCKLTTGASQTNLYQEQRGIDSVQAYNKKTLVSLKGTTSLIQAQGSSAVQKEIADKIFRLFERKEIHCLCKLKVTFS